VVVARGGVEPPTFRFKIDNFGDRLTLLDTARYLRLCQP